jgi:hypothetical protein
MAKTLSRPLRSATRGGVGCPENRRLAMTDEYGAPGLRERVIAVICEEWPKRRDNELQSATIYERLINEGVAVSYAALNNVLLELAQHNDITLELGSPTLPSDAAMTVLDVSSELCASSTAR